MSDLFSTDFLFRNAILGGLGVALLCSVLGVYLVLRRLVLIGVALPQAGAAGIAGVFWATGHGHAGGDQAHLLALAGSLGATFAALALLVAARRRSAQPAEWAVGALFAISSAVTVLFVALNPRGDLEMASLLRGELLAITRVDLLVLAGALFLVGSLFFLFRRELLLSSFDPEFARTLGRDPLRYDGLLYGLIGGGIALGVMDAGPLVVFGFLVLPALAGLRLAASFRLLFALSAAIAAVAFLAGFEISYRADLPTGPVSVAVAALLWAGASVAARLRARSAALLLLLALSFGSFGCAALSGREAAPLGALPRGSLPELDPTATIAVLRIGNETGLALRVPEANPLHDLGRAAGDPFAAPGTSVPDLLQQRAALELERRGYRVVPIAAVRDAVPGTPESPAEAARMAAGAGLDGPVLQGTLRRFTVTQTGLLLVRLELALVDASSQQVLWTGAAKRPVAIQASQTWQEIVLDAGGPIFADAFGSR
jgi:ABC-type Mn2+/Zn2+ transport system permease subunit